MQGKWRLISLALKREKNIKIKEKTFINQKNLKNNLI